MPDDEQTPPEAAAPARIVPVLAGRPVMLVSLLLGLPVVGMVLFGAGILLGHRWLAPSRQDRQVSLETSVVVSSSTPGNTHATPTLLRQVSAPSPIATPPRRPQPSAPRETGSLVSAPPKSNPHPAPRDGFTASQFEPDAEGWEVIKASTTPQDFVDFLVTFPRSRFALDAFVRLRQLQPAPFCDPQQVSPLQIRYAQISLRAAGIDPGPVDGICGQRTITALLTYQATRGMPTTGTLDAATQQALHIPSHDLLVAWQQHQAIAHDTPAPVAKAMATALDPGDAAEPTR